MDFYYLGTLMAFPYSFVPRDWAPCNGQLISIQSNTALYSLLGTMYGGDGTKTFALPRLNAASVGMNAFATMGQGAGPGLTPRVVGEVVGETNVTLTVDQIPMHNHSMMLTSGATNPRPAPTPGAIIIAPGIATYVAPGTPDQTQLGPTAVAFEGANQGHDNMQPYMELLWCIALTGPYPPRP